MTSAAPKAASLDAGGRRRASFSSGVLGLFSRRADAVSRRPFEWGGRLRVVAAFAGCGFAWLLSACASLTETKEAAAAPSPAPPTAVAADAEPPTAKRFLAEPTRPRETTKAPSDAPAPQPEIAADGSETSPAFDEPAMESVHQFSVNAPEKILGSVEYVLFRELPFPVESRVDTGATTSSIDARNVRRFERDGRTWVSYEVVDRVTGKEIELESPVVRVAIIDQPSHRERRFVVELAVSIDGRAYRTSEFTLSDRQNMDYPAIIGRNLLDGAYLVDVSAEYLLGDADRFE